MAAGSRYIASARTVKETPLPTVLLLLGEIAICADRTENACALLRAVVVTLNLITALSSVMM
jgi:hypothetical protein